MAQQTDDIPFKSPGAKPHPRIIGRYTGPERGPLLICLGGIHGNEPAGIQALELIFSMLEVEPIANPDFRFKGRIVGFLGNRQAYALRERFLNRDLNRMWTDENVKQVCKTPEKNLQEEYLELAELYRTIQAEVEDYRPDKLVILDLHTTTAHGGIFTIPTDDPESLRIAVELHAPVITGMLRGIHGTILHYFHRQRFGCETVAVAFESGQHDDPLSVNRAIAAVTNCLRTIGCVRAEDVENRHDELLIEYSKSLPTVADLIMQHPIKPGDHFCMEPNYGNFQWVKKGELLARDIHGDIVAPVDGCILMPLYQERGEDGFFIVKPVEY